MGWVKLTAWSHKRKFPPAQGCRSEGRNRGGLWSRPAASRYFSAVVTSCEGTGGGALSWSWLGQLESPNSWRKYVALNNCSSSLPSSVKLSKGFSRIWVYPLLSLLSPRFHMFWLNNFQKSVASEQAQAWGLSPQGLDLYLKKAFRELTTSSTHALSLQATIAFWFS